MGPWAAALSSAKLIPEQIQQEQVTYLTFDLAAEACSHGVGSSGARDTASQGASVYVQCKPLGCHGLVTHLSCFHCPLSRCYKTTSGAGAGAGAVAGLGAELHPAAFLELPENKPSLPRFTRGHSSSQREEYVRYLCHFCPRAWSFRRRIFSFLSV